MDDKFKRIKPHVPSTAPKGPEAKKAEEVKKVKAPTEPTTEGGGISRKKSSGKETKTLTAPDPSKPDLESPQSISPKEYQFLSASVGDKLGEQLKIEDIQQWASDLAQQAYKRAEDAAKKINDISKQGIPMHLRIMQMIRDITNLQIDLGVEYSTVIQTEQQEKQKEIQELTKKQKEEAAKSWISKIFSWIGQGLNLLLAAISVGLALSATASTGGAAAPAMLAATVWLYSAIIGCVQTILEDSGALNKIAEAAFPNDPEKADKFKMGIGFGLMAAQFLIAIGGATGSIAAAVKTGADALANSIATVNKIATAAHSITTMGEAGAKIANAVSQHAIVMAEAEKTLRQADLEKLSFSMQELLDFMKNMSKLGGDLAKTSTEWLRTGFSRDKVISGNV